MKRHLINIQLDGERVIWASSELTNLVYYLKSEKKTIGIICTEKGIKYVENDDFFDVLLFEVLRNNLTVVLDRNLLIAARNIFDNRRISDSVDRFFLEILAYAIFTDALLDPAIAIYEGGTSKNISALEDLKKIRTLDNLHLDTLLQVLFGELEEIDIKILNDAKVKIRQFDEKETNENFNKRLTLFKDNYPYMLKMSLLLRDKTLDTVDKIKAFHNWISECYISLNIPYIAVMLAFFNKVNLVKNINTKNREMLIHNIRNATWDITLLSYLKDQSKKNLNRYYLFATNDLNLVQTMRYCFSPDIEIEELFGKRKMIIKNMIYESNQLCSSKNRSEIVISRLKKREKLINNLEEEINLNK